MTSSTLTSKERRAIFAEEYRVARTGLEGTNGRVSGQQLAYAKGIARKRTFARIDALEQS